MGRKVVGFGSDPVKRVDPNVGGILSQVMPEDLLKYGLIPEFIGRLPIVVTLDALVEEDLVRILTEPKNALVRQYRKFFEIDKVELEFLPEALTAIAKKAIARKTGARGLRSIIESVMMNVMFDIPSRSDVSKCIVTREVIEASSEPILILNDKKEKKTKEETA